MDVGEFRSWVGVVMFRTFVAWALEQPEGQLVLADLIVVNEALSQGDQGGRREAYEAAVRLAQYVEYGPFSDEMVYGFGQIVEAWGLAGV